MIEILLWIFVLGVSGNFDPTKHPNWKLLPHDTCGEVAHDRIIGGKIAPMNSYPWIARVGCKKLLDSKFIFGCGGSVISSRVVISAAHCVLTTYNKSVIVRLGEHDMKTNPDCEGTFCADPYVEIETTEILIPNNYVSERYLNDIALFRLKKDIKFTAFVKPICLPSGDLLKKNLVGEYAEVAGWGIYNMTDKALSSILKTVSLPILKNEVCIKRFSSRFQIGPKQLCAGGLKNEDSCGGDSGGPFMMVDDGPEGPRYYMIGIVSYGPKICGKKNSPAIYTKLSSYLEWILDNLVQKSDSAMKIH